MNLYQINQKYIDIASILENEEVTPEMEKELEITEGEFKEKSIAYCCVVEGQEAEIKIIDELIAKLQDKKKKKQKTIASLKSRVLNAMNIFGIFKIETPIMKLSIRETPSVEVVNADQLSAEYLRTKTTTEPDKTKIGAALKAGEEIEGAILVYNQSLQIK